MKYGFSKVTNYSFEQAIEKVTDELKKEGFGILSSIDFKDTFKKKIDVDFKKYTVLGACNPKIAIGALQTEEELGLFLPCNVLVYEKDSKTVISIFDPMIMTLAVDSPEIKNVAEDVKNKLEKVLAAV
ncbi:MAG TPA: DUF302 domain-containing protein [Ignavibacteriaceae bacterium]|nr:DUF302 domain-containing protein [Ignavibacteriaceae bacterium]